MKFNSNNKCFNCRLMPICRYCPAKFYLTTGDYQNAPQWFCDYANQVYENFIKGYNILRKTYLSPNSLNEVFEIIKQNMIKIGFNPTNEDKSTWINNLKKELLNENFYFYVIYNNGEICGFIEAIEQCNQLIISEIQFNSLVKASKLILYVINFILKEPSFSKYNKAYFNINKNNAISNKTFKHLGATIVAEKEQSFKYEITRNKVDNYVKSLLKK